MQNKLKRVLVLRRITPEPCCTPSLPKSPWLRSLSPCTISGSCCYLAERRQKAEGENNRLLSQKHSSLLVAPGIFCKRCGSKSSREHFRNRGTRVLMFGVRMLQIVRGALARTGSVDFCKTSSPWRSRLPANTAHPAPRQREGSQATKEGRGEGTSNSPLPASEALSKSFCFYSLTEDG